MIASTTFAWVSHASALCICRPAPITCSLRNPSNPSSQCGTPVPHALRFPSCHFYSALASTFCPLVYCRRIVFAYARNRCFPSRKSSVMRERDFLPSGDTQHQVGRCFYNIFSDVCFPLFSPSIFCLPLVRGQTVFFTLVPPCGVVVNLGSSTAVGPRFRSH